MKCILCDYKDTSVLFSLENGPQYSQKLLESPDPKINLRVDVILYKCGNCGMVQINPDGLMHDEYFEDYLMSRSCTELYTEYDNQLAKQFHDKFQLSGKSLIEIGCGDGYFAEKLQHAGVIVSAIEPSETACKLAEKKGVKCFNIFLDNAVSETVTEKYDAFATKQVMDLIKDPNQFLKNLSRILKPGACGLIDVPSWTKTLMDKRYYDVLADRVGYYTANTLVQILERNNFHVVEVFHGAGDEYVGAYVIYEGEKNGLEKSFKNEFDNFNSTFSALLNKYISENKVVASWGAGAKGVTIFAFSGMSPDKIKYVIDKDPNKWHKYLPGSLIEVISPEILDSRHPDAIIITAAMFYREIIKELISKYKYNGDLILLQPIPRVLSKQEINEITG